MLDEFIIVVNKEVTGRAAGWTFEEMLRQRTGEVAGQPECKCGGSGIFAAKMFEPRDTCIGTHHGFCDPVPVEGATVAILAADQEIGAFPFKETGKR